MNGPNGKMSLYIGVVLIALGILLNRWLIAFAIIPDNGIESLWLNAIILAFQIMVIALGGVFVVVRPSIRLPSRGELILVVSSMLVTVIVAEFSARLLLPAPLIYERVLADTIGAPERMFRPGLDKVYDIRGLYEGATEVVFRTSDNRFIEPEPVSPARYSVLFLGGSTTEALYVPEHDRWVNLLNEPGMINTFNAGQSGANTLDKYYTFDYLSREGMQFDMVVLMTANNDLGWLRQLNEVGGSLRLTNYRSDLRKWYATLVTQSAWERLQERFILFYEINLAWSEVRKRISIPDFEGESDVSKLVIVKREMREAKILKGEVANCDSDGLELQQYLDNARNNILLLADAVHSSGAKFLVLSETKSTMAPPSSYYEYFLVPSDTTECEYSMWSDIHKAYLQAAEEAGAYTFDLASYLDPKVNGPDGGKYVYDSQHYTAEGSREVAQALRPVIIEILTRADPTP